MVVHLEDRPLILFVLGFLESQIGFGKLLLQSCGDMFCCHHAKTAAGQCAQTAEYFGQTFGLPRPLLVPRPKRPGWRRLVFMRLLLNGQLVEGPVESEEGPRVDSRLFRAPSISNQARP